MVDDIISSEYGAWASEKTMTTLLSEIEKLAGLGEAQKKALQDSVKEIKKTGKASVSKQEAVSVGKQFTTGLKKSTHAALDSAAGFDKLGGPMKDFAKSLKDSSMGMKVGLAGLGGIFALIGKGAAIYEKNLDTLGALSQRGVMLEGSYLGIQRTLAMTGMSLDQFNEISMKYTRVIGQNGLQAINNLTAKTSALAGGFKVFGITTADATEDIAEYLDQQRLVGVFRAANDRGQAAAIQQNMKDLTAYSKVLNVSTDDMMAAARTMFDDADLQAELFSIIDPTERQKAQDAFAKTSKAMAAMGAPGEEMLKNLTDIAAAPNPYGSEAYIRLSKAGQVEMANSLVAMAQAGKRGEDTTLAQVQAAMILTDEQIEQQRALRTVNGELRAEATTRVNMSKAAKEAQANDVENRRKASAEGIKTEEEYYTWLTKVNKDAQGAASLQDGLNKAKATADRAVIVGLDLLIRKLGEEEGVSKALDSAGTAIAGLTAKANLWLDGLQDSDNPLAMIASAISDTVTYLAEAIVSAITAGFMSLSENSVTGKIGKGASNVARWFSGADEKDAYALMSPEEQEAEDKRKYYSGGGALGRITPYKRPEMTANDTATYESIKNRQASGQELGEHSTALLEKFDRIAVGVEDLVKKTDKANQQRAEKE